METLRIDIINPKAKKLLNDLAELNLIEIKKDIQIDFSTVLKNLRAKSSESLSLDEIAKEVEVVRKSRYEK